MATKQTTSKGRETASSRSGHGAASVIPHLNEEFRESMPAMTNASPEAAPEPASPVTGESGDKSNGS